MVSLPQNLYYYRTPKCRPNSPHHMNESYMSYKIVYTCYQSGYLHSGLTAFASTLMDRRTVRGNSGLRCSHRFQKAASSSGYTYPSNTSPHPHRISPGTPPPFSPLAQTSLPPPSGSSHKVKPCVRITMSAN